MAWRVEDMPLLKSAGLHADVYERGSCESCGAAVWVQEQNAEGRTIICWHCGGSPPSR